MLNRFLALIILIFSWSLPANASYVAHCLIEGDIEDLEKTKNKISTKHVYDVKVYVTSVAMLTGSYENACNMLLGKSIKAPLATKNKDTTIKIDSTVQFEYFMSHDLIEDKVYKSDYFVPIKWKKNH